MHALPAVAQPAPSSVFADNMVLLLYTRAQAAVYTRPHDGVERVDGL